MRRLLIAILLIASAVHVSDVAAAGGDENAEEWKFQLDTFFHGYTPIIESLIGRRNFYADKSTSDDELGAVPLLDWNRALAEEVFAGFHEYIRHSYPKVGYLDPGGSQAPVWHGETELSHKLHSAKLSNLVFALTFDNRDVFFRPETYSSEPEGYALRWLSDDLFLSDIVRYSFGANPCPDLISVTWVRSEADGLATLPGATLLRTDIDRPYFPIRTLLLPVTSDAVLSGNFLSFKTFLAHMFAPAVESGYLDIDRVLRCAKWADAVKLVARQVEVRPNTKIELEGRQFLVVADRFNVQGKTDPSLHFYVARNAKVDDIGSVAELIEMGGSLDAIEVDAQLELANRAFLEGTPLGTEDAKDRLQRILSSEQPNVAAIEAFLAEGIVPGAAWVAFVDWEGQGHRTTFEGLGGKAAALFEALLQYGKILSGQDYFGVRLDYVPALTSDALRIRFEERLRQYEEFFERRSVLLAKTRDLDQIADRAEAEIEFIKTAEEPVVDLQIESLGRDVEVSKAALKNLNQKIVDLMFQIKDIEVVSSLVRQLITCMGCGVEAPDDYTSRMRSQTYFNNRLDQAIRLIENESTIDHIGSALRDLAYQVRAQVVEGENLAAQLAIANFERAGLAKRITALNNVVAGSTEMTVAPSTYDEVLDDLETELIRLAQRRRNALLYEYKLASDGELFNLSFDADSPMEFTQISLGLDRVRDEMFAEFGVRGSPDDVRVDFDQSYLLVRLLENPQSIVTNASFMTMDIADLKRTGLVTIDVGYRNPPSAGVAALDRSFRTAELVDAEVWYSVDSQCDKIAPLDLRVALDHGAIDSTISFRTGKIETYDVSDLDLERTVHATRRDRLLEDNFYESPNYPFVRDNLSRTDIDHFIGFSPATSWRIKILDADTPAGQATLQCLKDVSLVLLFNYR